MGWGRLEAAALRHDDVGRGEHLITVPLQGQERGRPLRVGLVEDHVAGIHPGVTLAWLAYGSAS